jgi:hypothetical protein
VAEQAQGNCRFALPAPGRTQNPVPAAGERRGVKREPALGPEQDDETEDHEVEQWISPAGPRAIEEGRMHLPLGPASLRMHYNAGVFVAQRRPLRRVPDFDSAPGARADVPGLVRRRVGRRTYVKLNPKVSAVARLNRFGALMLQDATQPIAHRSRAASGA